MSLLLITFAIEESSDEEEELEESFDDELEEELEEELEIDFAALESFSNMLLDCALMLVVVATIMAANNTFLVDRIIVLLFIFCVYYIFVCINYVPYMCIRFL